MINFYIRRKPKLIVRNWWNSKALYRHSQGWTVQAGIKIFTSQTKMPSIGKIVMIIGDDPWTIFLTWSSSWSRGPWSGACICCEVYLSYLSTASITNWEKFINKAQLITTLSLPYWSSSTLTLTSLLSSSSQSSVNIESSCRSILDDPPNIVMKVKHKRINILHLVTLH